MIDWKVVRYAADLATTDEKLALTLLTNLVMGANQGTGGQVIVPTPEPDRDVIYGRSVNGLFFTDGNDPRDLDCRSNSSGSGKPTSIHLQVHSKPDRRFKIIRTELLQEDESCNVYFSVTNKQGALLPAFGARLGSPYNNKDGGYDDQWQAPASPESIPMGRDSKFWSPNLGPYAAYLIDSNGQIESDICGSIGLLGGQHWSFRIHFQER